MAVGGPTCPECGHRWPQRHARYCGHCGEPLRAAAPPTGRALWVGRALAGAGALTLAVVLTQLDLRLPVPSDRVDLDPGTQTADPPLTRDEAASLRARVDPDRLRCEPRGCERWRVDAATIEGLFRAGAVLADDDLLVVLAGADAGDASDPDSGPQVVGLDPRTSERRWERPLPRSERTVATSEASLTSRLDGALVHHGGTVTALDRDGEVAWRDEPAGLDGTIHTTVDAGEVVLVEGETAQDGASRFLGALDAATGTTRWRERADEVAYLDEDTIVVVDAGLRYRALDPLTGELRWEHPELTTGRPAHVFRAGPWLLLEVERNLLELIDPETGDRAGYLHGTLVGVPRERDGWIVAVLASGEPGRGELAADEDFLHVLTIAPDASHAWGANIGEIRPWWSCCDITIGDDQVTIVSYRFERSFDLHTGELLDVDHAHERQPSAATDTPSQPVPGVAVLPHRDGGGMEVHTEEGVVTILGRPSRVGIVSWDPLVVADDRSVIGVRPTP